MYCLHHRMSYSVIDGLVVVYRAADELQNEAKSHVLKHVNVVTLYAMIFERHHYGIVLDLVPCGCLEEYIYKNKVLFNVM